MIHHDVINAPFWFRKFVLRFVVFRISCKSFDIYNFENLKHFEYLDHVSNDVTIWSREQFFKTMD